MLPIPALPDAGPHASRTREARCSPYRGTEREDRASIICHVSGPNPRVAVPGSKSRVEEPGGPGPGVDPGAPRSRKNIHFFNALRAGTALWPGSSPAMTVERMRERVDGRNKSGHDRGSGWARPRLAPGPRPGSSTRGSRPGGFDPGASTRGFDPGVYPGDRTGNPTSPVGSVHRQFR